MLTSGTQASANFTTFPIMSQQWEFDSKHVLAFLRNKRAKKMPTWKRLKIVHGLIWYRNHVRCSRTPRLEHLRTKLQ